MTEPKRVDWRVMIAGILSLTIIECVALMNGIDGVFMSAVIGIIGLAIGVNIPIQIKR